MERRRSSRYLCSEIVEISENGRGRRLTVLLEDLSPEGAAVSSEEPMEPGHSVELITGGLRAQARVRYCEKRETDFRVGLEFAAECRWQPEGDWRPEHMFLPPPAR